MGDGQVTTVKRALIVCVLILGLPISTVPLSRALAMEADTDAHPAEASGSSPFPLQLEARVPFAPTAFPSVGGAYIVYEMYLTNFSTKPMTLRRIEVLDAEGAASKPVVTFEGDQLNAILQPVGTQLPDGMSGRGQLGAGATAVVYMWVRFGNGMPVPSRLRHRVVTADNSIDGAIIGTHGTKLLVLAPPVRGAGWMASDGPSNDRNNHHRRGILALEGQMVISRRYAIDWFLYKNGASIAGDTDDPHSYYGYGESVFAVADATVLNAHDGQPDNIPGPAESFRTAVPITMDTVGGNLITLDLGRGHYAWYFHLQSGSIRVKPGDRVRRGQPLARIGCSGDANLPHLHFEVTTAAKLLAGEGIPYLIDRYRIWTTDKVWQTHTNELPLDRMLIEFAQDGEASGIHD